MKKTIYICNRCRKEIKENGTRIIPCFFSTATGEALEDITVPDDVHFCAKCSRTIMNDLLGHPEMPPGKNRKEQPEKAGQGKTKVDIGKVMALHDASWTNKDIAEEMGITERQVYQCIYYQKKKGVDADATGAEEL